jgi:C-terminal processing protease CtpA/Prc
VTHVGQTTRGTLSDVLSKPLPNGWSLNLSNEIYIDADGRRWEGVGIPPQIALDVFSAQDPTKGHVEAVRAIVAAIRSGTPISLSSN